MAGEITRAEVLRANVNTHSSLIDRYDDQTHFRAENKLKMLAILAGLRNTISISYGESKLRDIGCGTNLGSERRCFSGFNVRVSASAAENYLDADQRLYLANQG